MTRRSRPPQAARPTATPLAVGLRSAEEASPLSPPSPGRPIRPFPITNCSTPGQFARSLLLEPLPRLSGGALNVDDYEPCDPERDRVDACCSSLSSAFRATPADSERGLRSSDCLK